MWEGGERIRDRCKGAGRHWKRAGNQCTNLDRATPPHLRAISQAEAGNCLSPSGVQGHLVLGQATTREKLLIYHAQLIGVTRRAPSVLCGTRGSEARGLPECSFGAAFCFAAARSFRAVLQIQQIAGKFPFAAHSRLVKTCRCFLPVRYPEWLSITRPTLVRETVDCPFEPTCSTSTPPAFSGRAATLPRFCFGIGTPSCIPELALLLLEALVLQDLVVLRQLVPWLRALYAPESMNVSEIERLRRVQDVSVSMHFVDWFSRETSPFGGEGEPGWSGGRVLAVWGLFGQTVPVPANTGGGARPGALRAASAVCLA